MTMDHALILGIESSCDETSAAVVRGGRQTLSNVIASQHELHAKYGGVVPEIASRAHIERICPVIDEALETAGVSGDELDAIAIGNRPGLIGSLLVGVSAAKAMAWALGKPLVGVDHVRAHLIGPELDAEPIAYPALGLVISGGHTSMYRVDAPGEMELFGRTLDDAAGEAFDKAASMLQLGFPGGPAIEKAAASGDPRAERMPRTLLERDSLDFSFSGLKTAVLHRVCGKPVGRGANARFERDDSDLTEAERANIAVAFQEAVVDVLTTKLGRALERMRGEGEPPRSLLVGGGVTANRRVRAALERFGEQHGLLVRLPRMDLCIDNAAMIAALAHHRLAAGRSDGLDLEAVATTAL